MAFTLNIDENYRPPPRHSHLGPSHYPVWSRLDRTANPVRQTLELVLESIFVLRVPSTTGTKSCFVAKRARDEIEDNKTIRPHRGQRLQRTHGFSAPCTCSRRSPEDRDRLLCNGAMKRRPAVVRLRGTLYFSNPFSKHRASQRNRCAVP